MKTLGDKLKEGISVYGGTPKGASELKAMLDAWGSGFDGLIDECEDLADDLKNLRVPSVADSDHIRVTMLIEIAKHWYASNP